MGIRLESTSSLKASVCDMCVGFDILPSKNGFNDNTPSVLDTPAVSFPLLFIWYKTGILANAFNVFLSTQFAL